MDLSLQHSLNTLDSHNSPQFANGWQSSIENQIKLLKLQIVELQQNRQQKVVGEEELTQVKLIDTSRINPPKLFRLNKCLPQYNLQVEVYKEINSLKQEFEIHKIETSAEIQQLRTLLNERFLLNRITHNPIFQNKSQQNIQESSVSQPKITKCQLCRKSISGYSIRTPCNHYFHENCLQNVSYLQVKKHAVHLYCVCNTKLPMSVWDKSSLYYRGIKNQLYENQLNWISKWSSKLKFRRCQYNACTFIWVDNGEPTHSYCPLCKKVE